VAPVGRSLFGRVADGSVGLVAASPLGGGWGEAWHGGVGLYQVVPNADLAGARNPAGGLGFAGGTVGMAGWLAFCGSPAGDIGRQRGFSGLGVFPGHWAAGLSQGMDSIGQGR